MVEDDDDAKVVLWFCIQVECIMKLGKIAYLNLWESI